MGFNSGFKGLKKIQRKRSCHIREPQQQHTTAFARDISTVQRDVEGMEGKAVPDHVKKTWGGVEVLVRSYLSPRLGGGEWSTSRSGRFTPGKELRYPLNRRLGGLQSQSGRLEGGKKILAPDGIRVPQFLYRLRYPGYESDCWVS